MENLTAYFDSQESGNLSHNDSLVYSDNVEDVFLLLSKLNIGEWTLMNQGALVVVLDMCLVIVSVFFNLMVITSIKENDELLGITFNLVLINLCSANLLSAVMVKSISIVHHAYAVAANSTQSNIAFCILYSFGYRLTWSILPWSVVALCWLTVLPRFRRLQVRRVIKMKMMMIILFQVHFSPALPSAMLPTVSKAMEYKEGETMEMQSPHTRSFSLRGSAAQEEDDTALDDEEEQLIGGLSMFDKAIMGSIWGVSFIYGILTEHVLSKKVDLPCSVSDHIGDNFGIASIILAIIIPTFLGPVMVTIIHIIISIVNVVMKNAPIAADLKNEELRNIFCTFLLTFIFLFTYIMSMVICEVFLPPNDDNLLYFVILKYIAGTSHHLLGPLCILSCRQDICTSAIFVYKRGGTTQSKSFEITAEQIQKELGLAVNP